MQPATLQAGPGMPGVAATSVGGRPELDWPADEHAVVLPINDRGGVHLVDDGYADIPDADLRGWTIAPGASCDCLPTVKRIRDGGTITRIVVHHAFDGRASGQLERDEAG